MPVAEKIVGYIERSSWIRAMFEAGAKLKAQYGDENVYDFSLGNPNIDPPEDFYRVVRKLVADPKSGDHGYGPNSGHVPVRQKVADYLSKIHEVPLTADSIIMTVGAAGGLNIALKTILNPGDEVVVPAPLFVEYGFYVENHGGKMVTVPTNEDFSLDIDALAGAITPKTAAVLINNPNNPTGAVYDQKQIDDLAAMLLAKSNEIGRQIYLISDEPYRQIVFDGLHVPSTLKAYPHSIMATSFSKNLSLPGERIGYVAVGPEAADHDLLLGGMTLANRILGFVNAPVLQQRIVAELLEHSADISQYARKREMICQVLEDAGYEFIKPGGTFYVYPKSPIADDVAFVKAAQEENLLLVPGAGFMGPGHFRIAFCCSDETIERSAGAFQKVRSRF